MSLKGFWISIAFISITASTSSGGQFKGTAELQALIAAVADTLSMSWEDRWALSKKLLMAPIEEYSIENALFVNRKSLEAHKSNYDAYWQRIRLLRDADHLTIPERVAAIQATIEALLGGDRGSGRFLDDERLRAHIYGLHAIYQLRKTSEEEETARQLARERLESKRDCGSDWIFLDFLAQTALSTSEEMNWYKTGQSRCERHKIKAEFYRNMIVLAEKDTTLMGLTEIGQLLREWSAYLSAIDAELLETTGRKSYSLGYEYELLGVTGAEYYLKRGSSPESRKFWLGVAEDAFKVDEHPGAILSVRFHWLSALDALSNGEATRAAEQLALAKAEMSPFRDGWVASGGDLSDLVADIERLSREIK